MNNGFLIQHTVKREVWCRGVGLHSGKRISMKLKPAPPNFGLRFRRTDLAGHPTIIAHHQNVVDTRFATTIGSNGAIISTIEHMMAALAGFRVDNILIELDGPEVPIFDGSAETHLKLLQKAGLAEQRVERHFLKIEKPIVVRDGDAYIKATPSDGLRVDYFIDFSHPLVGRQEFSLHLNEISFAHEIARARTFGFIKDVQKLKSMGLVRGGSLHNAIVFDEYGILNDDGFRYSNECVRHKILDFIGDLSLAGMPLIGHFEAYKAGHALHNRFVKQLVASPEAYAILTSSSLIPPLFRAPTLTLFPDRLASAVKMF